MKARDRTSPSLSPIVREGNHLRSPSAHSHRHREWALGSLGELAGKGAAGSHTYSGPGHSSDSGTSRRQRQRPAFLQTREARPASSHTLSRCSAQGSRGHPWPAPAPLRHTRRTCAGRAKASAWKPRTSTWSGRGLRGVPPAPGSSPLTVAAR